MKADDGVSGILGFVLMVGIVVALAGIISAALIPHCLLESETEHNEQALFAFAELQSGMDALCFAEKPGLRRSLALEDTTGTARISLAHGKDYGGGLREAVILYEAETILAEPLTLTLDADGLQKNGILLIPANFRFAVWETGTPEQMESTGVFRIEYVYLESVPETDIRVFSVRLS